MRLPPSHQRPRGLPRSPRTTGAPAPCCTRSPGSGRYRDFHTPWEAWANTWIAAFDHTQPTGNTLVWQAELLAMLVGIALLVPLVQRRRDPEAPYTGLRLSVDSGLRPDLPGRRRTGAQA